jgi:two-component sensor histidine kinase
MREMSHRAKNQLGLVQAIARQTATRNPEDFTERFSERIKALAANQDLLIRNEWKGVDIEELVRAQLAHFADIVGSRIVVRGQKLHLKAAAAQAIGLACTSLRPTPANTAHCRWTPAVWMWIGSLMATSSR